MKPYYSDSHAEIWHGDCRDVLPHIGPVDAVVTDPPYGLTANKKGGSGEASLNLNSPAGRSRISTGGGFMGQKWDAMVPGPEYWSLILDTMKPGAHLVAFGGTRTHHRLMVAIEDAGFEIRDCFMWLYGSGFPKSADISKHIDRAERYRWLEVVRAIDKLDESVILSAWKDHSNRAHGAALSFRKNPIVAGTNTQESGSALGSVLLQTSQENSDALAVIAELGLAAAHPTCGGGSPSAPSPAESDITVSSALVTIAKSQHGSRGAAPDTMDSSALPGARDWLDESTAANLRGVEALKTWLGRKKSSSAADTDALCAALTDDLRRITLSRSKTFQNFAMTQRTDCASAINAIITQSTAENLISFMVATLRNKAIDKVAGAEREIVGQYVHPSLGPEWANYPSCSGVEQSVNTYGDAGRRDRSITAPATDAARRWDGWGTALKPAWEPIILARKPLIGTVAQNVLEYGTGALNIEACRVGTDDKIHLPGPGGGRGGDAWRGLEGRDDRMAPTYVPSTSGRWPANLILDEESAALLDEQSGKLTSGGGNRASEIISVAHGHMKAGEPRPFGASSGGASRFFYTAKASRSDRGEGNDHPTVKPSDLIKWLIRLITPPGGVVLDPFMGSGTTLYSAKELGFRSIGIELEEASCKIAAKRLSQGVLDLEAS